MQPIIEAHHLSKIYGKGATAFLALSDINLAINQGESVAIVGKSGSGKSTLMHCLALLDTPTSGELKISGTNVKKLRARKLNRLRNRRFGFVFQQFFMNSSESVLDNVLLPLKISGTRRRERRRLALEAINTVDLADKAKVKAMNLSGGQKQRVCIARAIVNSPKVLFADEPTGNLDSATGEKIIKLLFDLNHDQGVTLIIVTHDEDLAALCDRRIRIADGKIVIDESIKSTTRPTTRLANAAARSRTKPANTPERKKAAAKKTKGVRK